MACARVAHLIESEGLVPNAIWMISRTRFTVPEIVGRIAAHLSDAEDACAVKLATLDSHRWEIQSGFDAEDPFPASERDVGLLRDLVCLDPMFAEYLDSVDHLVVDQADDMTGTLADLVIEMARRLNPYCGVTVFVGVRDLDPHETEVPTLVRRIRQSEVGFFKRVQLKEAQPTESVTPVSPSIEVREGLSPQEQIPVPNEIGQALPERSPAPVEHLDWNPLQRAVIEATPEDRLIFSPDPANGTAALACARVCALVDNGAILPNYVWIIASHPTAVQQIRTQISLQLKSPEDAEAVNIARLDQDAWTIHCGSDHEAQVLRARSDNIAGMCEFVCTEDAVGEYLEYVDHLVVHEAGSLSGNCADLVVEMVRKLREDCGVTVFADEARATHVLTGDRGSLSAIGRALSLSQRIHNGELGAFRILESTGVKLTDSDPEATAVADSSIDVDRLEEAETATGPGKAADGSSRTTGVGTAGPTDWDQSQRDVIEAPHKDRLLVSAGPGTGKTAVACARVAHLIDSEDRVPNCIWVISFTRTAVREVRDRIASHLSDPSDAHAVKLATLDSHAWAIQSGFDEKAAMLGSYDENIERLCDLVRSDEAVAEYLETVEHLVIDEAQDLVGVRADLVIEMIGKLHEDCGVTVFADEAQAIYGFADDREARSAPARKPPLPQRIRRGAASAFRECELAEIHRTNSPNLIKIFRDTRRKVLGVAGATRDGLAEVRQEVRRLAHGTVKTSNGGDWSDLEDAFVLYRRRCDVLLRSSFLVESGVSHRIRMSGLPACIVPWIGGLLSEHTSRDLHREEFTELWSRRVFGTPWATCKPEEAWENLVRVAGRTNDVVDLTLLRSLLGRKQPPAELCLTEFGERGPVVGTIHASKGREADTVHLMLPHSSEHEIDHEEEARVVFVGATRGRSELRVGDGYGQFAGRLEASGRAYSRKTWRGRPKVQVEIGREGDITASGLAGRRYFEAPPQIRAAQDRLRSFATYPKQLVASLDRYAGFAYRLHGNDESQCLAVLSQMVNNDLFRIADAIGGLRRPPRVIPHLSVHGARTVVMPLGAPELEELHEPWASSGMLLAPLLLGYTTLVFPYRSN